MKTVKKVILGLVVLFVIIQLIPVDRTNPPVDKKLNFTDVIDVPQKAETILRNACYDCHSNETAYPKYAYVAPISWSVKDHVNEGREHANFSEWGKYSQEAKNHILEESIAEIERGKMPLKGYDIYHPEAKLSQEDKDYIISFLKNLNP